MSRLWPKCKIREPTRIHHSTNLETAIQWCSLKYNRALKSHPNVKVHMNYRLNHIIKFNIRLSTFTKFVEFLKINTANTSLKVFFLFSRLKICLSYAYDLTTFSLYMFLNIMLIKQRVGSKFVIFSTVNMLWTQNLDC